MKATVKIIIIGLFFIGCFNFALAEQGPKDSVKLNDEVHRNITPGAPYSLRGFAGAYLSSHFAQSQNNWKTARDYLDSVLIKDKNNKELLKRSMILAMGSGDLDKAVSRARALALGDQDTSLAVLILTVNAIIKGHSEEALSFLKDMPKGDMTEFLRPILKGWIDAETGKVSLPNDFGETSLHLYHGALMAYLAGKTSITKDFTDKLMKLDGLSAYEGERIADLQVALGEEEAALVYYRGLSVQGSSSATLPIKIKAVENNKIESIKNLIAPLSISSSAQGAALSMLDMSRILYQEQSDSSAKLFVNIALALDPELYEARLLLANTLTRNVRIDDALEQYKAIPKSSPYYLESQHLSADLLAEADRVEEAQTILLSLYDSEEDIEALIRVGDLYRQVDDYERALHIYNKAAEELGDQLDESYWYLLYARGMSYERLSKWAEAEADLKQALEYRPENPYLMNYLGYGWADQGEYLDQSLELIQRAVSLRPSDGYITDSLGWVHYMMGNYNSALPHLERAVELLPYDPVINDHLGDVYWRVGRRLEAKYQWERAFNHTKEAELKEAIQNKLKQGLADSRQKHIDQQEPNHKDL